MPKLILRCNYLKNAPPSHLANYMNYISTREGVEKIDNTCGLLPVTVKQKELIADILSKIEDADRMGSEVHIDIFDDRLEIYSPGGMYDGTLIQDRDIDNVPSKRRNPVVADIFSRLDYMERRGSGFKKIMQAYEVEPNYTEDKKPAFYSNATEFRVILKNLNFTDEVLNEKNEVLDEVLNEVLDSGRTEMEIKVIKAILSSPRIKQKELAEQVGISVSTIQRTIKKLVKEGKIVRVNGKRDGYWKVL